MKKGLSNYDKAKEIHRLAVQRVSFKQDLAVFVKKFSVPQEPKYSKGQIQEWLLSAYESAVYQFYAPRGLKIPIKYKKLPGKEYISERMKFLRRYGFSVAMDGGVMDEILVGETPAYECFEIEPPSEKDEKDLGRRVLKIVVYEGATEKGLIRYIEREWKWMKAHLKGKIKAVRSRTTESKKRHQLVQEHMDKSLSELKKELGIAENARSSKEALVSRILKENHRIKLSADSLRKTVSRQSKLKNG
ncbi:MAG: hypothetical protein A2937_01565 [Candidatus Yonathbacteria bacterium RIFCSPLOWO2_01_FULL_47_33b]|uniref:Uncharacterized protein n=1 Tax=Candidatus Yonathbacteria bacterium RIFCSPLOWO2_01_FULL_47_33b TaxID=1802727 RepID=A0A1G2SI27_9BACT|nr:MAG: hypothetical protein A2937_01565 [Candidatus Yonathbacteria bacterium RIFCSPLOWO2_01_FULL_47_33b]